MRRPPNRPARLPLPSPGLRLGHALHATLTRSTRTRGSGDRGEGVISTAIAVLIVAFIGAAMWVAFEQIWTGAEGNIQREVGNIGGGAP